MKERPILFAAPMVRAILDGRKTQTRRIVKPQPHADIKDFLPADPSGFWGFDGKRPVECVHCSLGQVGDQLWVRETWQAWSDFDKAKADDISAEARERLNYPANGNVWDARQRPSIHMPRWASRILLEIIGVRVERLNDISEADAIAEGTAGGHGSIPGYGYAATPTEHYRHLWESLAGPGSWATNPWVWVVEFKRVQP